MQVIVGVHVQDYTTPPPQLEVYTSNGDGHFNVRPIACVRVLCHDSVEADD